ncbi:hypothetical protein ACN38_g6870, partial [Penicillium nordicum]
WYIQYSKSHDLYGIIPCKSMYATLHFDNIQSSLPPSRYLGVMFFNEVEWHFVLRRRKIHEETHQA